MYFPKEQRKAVKGVFEQLQKVGKNAIKSTRIQRLLKTIEEGS